MSPTGEAVRDRQSDRASVVFSFSYLFIDSSGERQRSRQALRSLWVAPSRSVRRADAGRLAPSTSPQRGRALCTKSWGSDELFSAEFQRALVASYQARGQEPCPPALLAMVTLLQKYDQPSAADAVDAAENHRRWQLVLGTSGGESAPFGQGTLVRFRTRAIANDLGSEASGSHDRGRKRTGKLGWKHLRVALDSSPLHGAGRVETWNLIGRAMAKVVRRAEHSLGRQHQSGTGRRSGRRPGPGRGAPAIANLHKVARRRAA